MVRSISSRSFGFEKKQNPQFPDMIQSKQARYLLFPLFDICRRCVIWFPVPASEGPAGYADEIRQKRKLCLAATPCSMRHSGHPHFRRDNKLRPFAHCVENPRRCPSPDVTAFAHARSMNLFLVRRTDAAVTFRPEHVGYSTTQQRLHRIGPIIKILVWYVLSPFLGVRSALQHRSLPHLTCARWRFYNSSAVCCAAASDRLLRARGFNATAAEGLYCAVPGNRGHLPRGMSEFFHRRNLKRREKENPLARRACLFPWAATSLTIVSEAV